MLQMLGHDGPPTQFWRKNVITDEELRRCPMRDWLEAEAHEPALVAEVRRHLDEYFPAYQQGLLLEAGGLANQPALYAEYMRRLARIDAAVQAKVHAPQSQED
jgi:hypothetical protein